MAFFVFFAEAAGLRDQINEGVPPHHFCTGQSGGPPDFSGDTAPQRNVGSRLYFAVSVCGAAASADGQSVCALLIL